MSCSKIRRKNDNYSCFISQLPISIIHHILSLLPNKDSAKTCVLSKTWNNFYASRHIMFFHESDFKEGIEGKKLFMNYIDKSLNRRMQMTTSNDPFERFELHMKCDPDDESQPGRVNDWLQKVFGIGVKTMSLLLLQGDKLCGLAFDSQTLVELNVHCLFFMRACKTISLPNLKVLTLSCVSLNDESLKRLISGCPMVEILCLSECDTSRKLQVSGLARLVKLELSYCKDVEMVEICSPYFETFSSCGGDGPSTIELMGSCERVKKLELNAWLSTKFSAFRFLEELKLESLHIRGRISSQSLKTLVIKSCGAETEMVEIDCPNLMCLQYENNHKPFRFVGACNPIDFRYESCLLQSKRSVQMNALENLFRSTFGATRNLNVVISLSPRKPAVTMVEGLFDVVLFFLRKLADVEPRISITSHSFDWNGVLPGHLSKGAHLHVFLVSSRGSQFVTDVSEKFLSLHKSRHGGYANLCSLEKQEQNSDPDEPRRFQIDRIVLKFD